MIGDVPWEAIQRYTEEHTSPPPPHLAALSEETHERMSSPQMLSGAVEGRLLETLVFASGARRILEIGTFTGYSALAMAAALPHDGELITCELDPERAEFARRHFASSPYGDRIEVRDGPALDTIAQLDGPFDIVFIDADKPSYADYYEATLPLLSERGLIIVDNTLWSGRVLAPDDGDESTKALAAFNDKVVADPRVVVVQLTVRDGVTLIRRAA
jgi:caffeoyl-CoA O-methyltransferase